MLEANTKLNTSTDKDKAPSELTVTRHVLPLHVAPVIFCAVIALVMSLCKVVEERPLTSSFIVIDVKPGPTTVFEVPAANVVGGVTVPATVTFTPPFVSVPDTNAIVPGLTGFGVVPFKTPVDDDEVLETRYVYCPAAAAAAAEVAAVMAE